MEWSTGVARIQASWRTLLEEDPDQAIEALAGLSIHARSRARALVTLAERHAVGGGHLVDSGLQAFQETAGSYTEITSFQLNSQVPQAPAGSPPPKTPTVATPKVAAKRAAAVPKDPPARSSQATSWGTGGQAAAGPQTTPTAGQQVPAGQQDPWHGWHSGLLGQDGRRVSNNVTQAASRESGGSVYNSADQAAAKARGVQSGTRSASQPAAAATEHRSPQVPSSEHLLLPDMSDVPAEAWGRDLGYCHGSPAALVGTVGLAGDLPPMPAYRCFLPLRRDLQVVAGS